MSEFREKLEKLRNKYLENPSNNEPIYCRECFTIIEPCGCESSTPAATPWQYGKLPYECFILGQYQHNNVWEKPVVLSGITSENTWESENKTYNRPPDRWTKIIGYKTPCTDELSTDQKDQHNVIGTCWPLVYLMPEGLSLEWEINGYDISFRTVDGKHGFFHSLHLESGNDLEREMDLHEIESWQFLNDYINKIINTKKSI